MGAKTVLGGDGWFCISDAYCVSGCCAWPTYGMIGCDALTLSMHNLQPADPIMPKQDAWQIFCDRQPCAECVITQTLSHAAFPPIYSKVIFRVRQCGALSDGVRGAESDPAHTPAYYPHAACHGIQCECLGAPVWLVGFDHAKVNTRNLSVIASHAEEQYQNTSHCLGIVWGDGGSTNLFNLLCTDGFTDDIRTNLYFTSQVNAKGAKAEVQNHILPFGAKPKDMEPRIFHVELRHREKGANVLDRLWVTVNSLETLTNYNNWVAANATNMAWALTLAPPDS